MRKVLLTGGAGFLGSHVGRELLESGYDVVVLDDLSGGFEDHVDPRAELVVGDVCDRELVESLFRRHGFRYVYHLAAYAAEGLSPYIRRYNYANNLLGSVTLVNAAVNYGVECFVFTSSIAVYGAGQVPMTEAQTPKPEDPYGIAKLAVEQDLAAATRTFGLDHVIFRPHNVYGEHQNIGDRYRNAIGIFMNQLMRGEPMTVFGDGEQTRAFTHVAEVASVIARSVEVPAARNETFNVGADRPYTVNELAAAVARAMGETPRIRHVAERDEVRHAYCDHVKAERVFGRPDPVPLDEGLARMAAWARRVGPRRSREFDGVEIRRGLPAVWLEAAPADPGVSGDPVPARGTA